MSKLTITGLNANERKTFESMLKKFSEGRESDLKGCQIWVEKFSEERREEIYESCDAHRKKKLRIIEGVGLGFIHPSLLWSSHSAAMRLMSLPREKQDRFISEGIPTIRSEDGKLVQRHLSHEEMGSDDVKIAFDRTSTGWKHRSLVKQKEAFQEVLPPPADSGERKRGFGDFDLKKGVFTPAPIRSHTGKGYTLKEVEDIAKEMKRKGFK